MYDGILQELLDRVPGARGAVFCDDMGESVNAVGASGRTSRGTVNDFDLRIAGAQLATPLERVRLNSAENIGNVGELLIRGPRETLLVHILPEGYYLVLCLEPDALTSRGAHELRLAARRVAAAM